MAGNQDNAGTDGAGAGDNADGGSSGDKGGKGSVSGDKSNDSKLFPEEVVHELRAENGKHRIEKQELRVKLKALEDAADAASAAKLAEEKKFEELAAAEKKRADKAHSDAKAIVEDQRKKTIRTAAKAELIAQGVIDPDDVALLDLAKATWDDDAGEPAGVTELVAAFKAAKPAKFKVADDAAGGKRAVTSTPGGTGNKGGGKGINYLDPAITDREVNLAWAAKHVRS